MMFSFVCCHHVLILVYTCQGVKYIGKKKIKSLFLASSFCCKNAFFTPKKLGLGVSGCAFFGLFWVFVSTTKKQLKKDKKKLF